MAARSHKFTLGILVAIGLALVPPVLMILYGASDREVILACLGCFGWLVVGVLMFHEGVVHESIREAIRQIGVSEASGGLTEIVDHFVKESVRYHRAAYAFRANPNSQSANLSQNLRRVVELTYHELNARSVELSLFDEEQSMWSQTMLIGDPKIAESQSMLVGEVEKSASEVLQEPGSEPLLTVAKPVTFAGTLFGVLRVEFRKERRLSKSDREVLHLLATQGGLLLVDARFTDELLRMRRLAEESTRAKTGFLANLSHEIRGPLGIILNAVEMSLNGLCGPISPAMEESLGLIKGSGDHLLDLVNDVLDYAKVEAGKISANPIDMPLQPLLDDLVTVVRSQAVAKRHNLVLEEVPALWGVLVDKRHVRQMLINFLTNSIKYTPEGGTITVSAEQVGAGRMKIVVEDTGIGIPKSEQHKVFGAFERVEDQYAQAQMGTGLGMPLTKQLAEVNRGSVGFQSEQGKGSKFWIILPYVEMPEFDPKVVEESGKHAVMVQGDGEHIVIVDHDEGTRRMLARYLSEQGFKTTGVSSGPALMKQLRKGKIDVAIVENDFADLPGEQMVEMIRSTPTSSEVPIILLSARAFVFDIERFLKLGVDRCLSKPVALSELAFTVRRLIDEARSLEQFSPPPH